MNNAPHIVVIPACNEAGHIGRCLNSLAGQASRVLLLVNNSADGTERIAAREAGRTGLNLMVAVRRFEREHSSAGHARHVALALAASLAPGAALLTTDADSRVAPDWVAANLRHLAAGVDAVAGRAVIDPVDAAAIPARLHADDALECTLSSLLEEITAVLDPDPADPWPRHAEHSGASICVSAEAFHRAGGMPDQPAGEDRAFFAALRRTDAIIRHAPEVSVTVSGRTVGRAQGGMADTIRRRLLSPDAFLDDTLEPARAAERRARLRRAARAAWHSGSSGQALALALRMPAGQVASALRARCFGEAWFRLEAAPVLARAPVPAGDVLVEIARARAILDGLKISPVHAGDPSDTSRLADALRA